MPSTKILLTAAAVCFLFGLAVPTVAITVGEDSASDDVVLEPTSQYAVVHDDELRLDLEALNERAVTHTDGVFAITVTDDTVEAVWLENDVDGLEFYSTADPTTEITDSSPLEPAAGETIAVGAAVDTRIAQQGTETFSVHVAYEDEDGSDGEDDSDDDEPKVVALESLAVGESTVAVGDSVVVNATYRNHGSETKQTTAALVVDGTIVDTETVDLEPDTTETVTFERSMQWPGTYEVGVDGAASESVTVEGPPVDVLEADVTETELTAGGVGTVEATVSNPTDRTVERTLELAVDDIVVETRTVSIEPNDERTVAFERQFDEAGTYDVAVSGVTAGSVTVSEPDPVSVETRELSAAATAALAPPMAMGLLCLSIAANRRWALVST